MLNITIVNLFPSGMYHCSTMHQGRVVQCNYMGYRKREALQQFRAAITHTNGGVAA